MRKRPEELQKFVDIYGFNKAITAYNKFYTNAQSFIKRHISDGVLDTKSRKELCQFYSDTSRQSGEMQELQMIAFNVVLDDTEWMDEQFAIADERENEANHYIQESA